MGVAGGVPREQRPIPFAGGAGRTAGPVTIYVANKAGNTVTPIRAASNRAGRAIRVGPGPAPPDLHHTLLKTPCPLSTMRKLALEKVED
jgi:hypothetical protein